jgi:hypothetical protein
LSPRSLGRAGIWAGATTATALGLLLAVSASAAPPTLTVVATDAVIGQTIAATAELSESPAASGEISFEVFGPDDPTCAGPALEVSETPVSGEGQYASADFAPATTGLYHWSARYSGDGENPAAEAPCAAISTVAKASPDLTGAASSAVVGSAIHDEVTLTGGSSPDGEVTFSVYGPADTDCSTPLATTSSPLESGEATSADFIPQQAGGFRWTANYEGDADNEAVELPCGAANQTSPVSKASPGLTGSATSTVVVGNTITDQATLGGGFSPGGQIVFRAYGPGDSTCATAPAYEEAVAVSGNGPYSPAGFAPGAGLYRWTVEYEGDGNNEVANVACGAANQTSTVSKASPGLTGSATSTVVVGNTITDQVTLGGGFSPGGQIVFRAYGPGDSTCGSTAAYEETVAISGNDSYSPAGFAPGPGLYRWTVEYEGDANNEGAALGCNSSGQTSTVAKAAPGLTGSASSGVVGNAIHDEVTLTGGFSPGGEVTFSVYGPADTTCATPLETMSVAVAGGKTTSDDFVPQQAGGFRWTASYGGDANNEAVSLGCNAGGQTSPVAKASPNLAATATSTVVVGNTITDQATLGGGFSPGGQIVFRAYGPGDSTCATAPAYEEAVAVSGNGPYSPAGFAPGAGLYRWTVEYEGDGNNETAGLGCGTDGQGSAVGAIDVTLASGATGGTVGTPVTATATLEEAAIPGGQIVFDAFPPGDVNCSGTAAFSSTIDVTGNGSYRSAAFVPTRVGTFRWTVAYSGDPNHAPAAVACGKAASAIAPAKPAIAGAVPPRIPVGTAFRDAATLRDGYSPGGTVTFHIYGPVKGGCDGPEFVNTVAVNGNGTVNSDPFVALRTGRYSFAVSYSGDAENQAVSEPCDSPGQVVQVVKRAPKVKPRARLVGSRQIAIRAHLSGGVSPSGAITFRLYGPEDKRCRRKPAFSGGVTVKSNGTFPLARYIATKAGVYRLSVGYSGDQRNQRYKGSCGGAQPIRIASPSQ